MVYGAQWEVILTSYFMLHTVGIWCSASIGIALDSGRERLSTSNTTLKINSTTYPPLTRLKHFSPENYPHEMIWVETVTRFGDRNCISQHRCYLSSSIISSSCSLHMEFKILDESNDIKSQQKVEHWWPSASSLIHDRILQYLLNIACFSIITATSQFFR